MSAPDRAALDALQAARGKEREQAAFYRALAAEAERAEDAAAAERLNELHADEQHQLSRLTARLLELGERVGPVRGDVADATLDGWERAARLREAEEVARYEALLERRLDAETRALVREILRVERLHAENLGGKWMGA